MADWRVPATLFTSLCRPELQITMTCVSQVSRHPPCLAAGPTTVLRSGIDLSSSSSLCDSPGNPRSNSVLQGGGEASGRTRGCFQRSTQAVGRYGTAACGSEGIDEADTRSPIVRTAALDRNYPSIPYTPAGGNCRTSHGYVWHWEHTFMLSVSCEAISCPRGDYFVAEGAPRNDAPKRGPKNETLPPPVPGAAPVSASPLRIQKLAQEAPSGIMACVR